MRAELVLLGRRVDMARRTRRRALVVGIYSMLAALFVGMWFADHWRTTGTFIFWAAMLACWQVLGGYYSHGLVKPFTGKGPRQLGQAPLLLLLKLRMYPAIAGDDVSGYRNDERELHQRDRAHYQAYQALGLAMVAVWLAAFVGMGKPQWMGAIAMTPYQLFYGMMMVMFVLFLTLPQCILLWTEPDMEKEG
jgi:hypothetical protein